MKRLLEHPHRKTIVSLGIPLLIFVLMGIGFGSWATFLRIQNSGLSSALSSSELTRARLEEKVMTLEDALQKETEERLVAAEQVQRTLETLRTYQSELANEKSRADQFASEIENLTDTVNVLQKLKILDKELLQKYSKTYFLNEHYTPQQLSTIDPVYGLEDGKTYEIHTSVWPFLKAMLDAAWGEAVPLRVVSAYRSFDEQSGLKATYKVTYGSGANQFSADQGYSEHQLGTTIDLTTPSIGGAYLSFKDTRAYSWLLDHAHEYGFVLSYPSNNAYYEYEPWHWRFVGQELAAHLHETGQFFYDMDQRDIDEYLLTIFN